MAPNPDRPGAQAEPGPSQGKFDCIVVGGGSLARGCLEQLIERGHDVRALVSDDPALLEWAKRHDLTALALDDPSGEGWGLEPADHLFSIANLRLLGPAALTLGRRSAINFHDGPLPDYVGVNCPAWAIINGEESHAVTWHLMTRAVDAGAVAVTERIAIDPGDTAYALNAKCYEAGLRTFGSLLDRLERGDLETAPQEARGGRRYGRVDRPLAGGWLDLRRPARDLVRLVQALDFGPEPNPLALPALVGPAGTVLVGAIDPLPDSGESAVGEVVAVEAGIRVRTAAGDVLLGEFCDHGGRALTAAAALAEIGARVGDRLPLPDEATEQGFTRAARAWLKHEEWWARRLAEAVPLEAQFLQGTEAVVAAAPSERTFSVPPLAELAASGGVAPPVATLGLVGLLLARLDDKASVDVPLRVTELGGIAGTAAHRFSAAVPLRVALEPGESFAHYVGRLGRELAALAAKGTFLRDLPLRARVASVDPNWADQQWPLTVSLANDGEPAVGGGVEVVIGADGTGVRVRGAAADGAVLAAFGGRLQALAEELAAGRSVDAASILSPADHRALAELNGRARSGPQATSVHQEFLQQASRTPERTALVASGRELSYAALSRRVHGLARELVRRGVERGDRVGLMCLRSADMIIALLAILEAGAAYVPLDPEFPEARLDLMARDADLALVLADAASAAHVPTAAPARFVLDAFTREADSAPDVEVGSDDLAYVIYTSGSTGKPKGVMLEHGNVLNFFVGIDEAVGSGAEPGRWLAVTSISFDISVLELLWTLARGQTVVLYDGEAHRVDGPAKRPAEARRPLDMSLFYFSADAGEQPNDKYRLLLEGARFADEHGFSAVWTPERHFHDFGGLYPNPAVTGAAVAAITRRVRIRAGSCVLPLHSPIRIAEEWSVVDNISGGRVDVSFASGWQPNDFVLAPGNYDDRQGVMQRGVETVRALWRGEKRSFSGHDGRPVEVVTLPRPVQKELPVWVTAAGNPATFRAAGEMGAGLLTHLLGQDLGSLQGKIAAYREAWRAAGHAGEGHVSLMLHAFLAESPEAARAAVWEPLRDYLRTSTNLMQQYASTFPAFRGIDGADRQAIDERFRALSAEDVDALLEHACQRYYETSGLFGTVDQGEEFAARVSAAGVDEIACLIDFGIPSAVTLAGLEHLARLLERLREKAAGASTIPELIARHGVTHLQCTPSMAQMLASLPEGRAALTALDTLLVGGEALPRDLARDLTSLTGRVINMYGPTETTVWSTFEPVDPAPLEGEATVPIGRPLANQRVYVCDRNLQPLPPGVAGELVIGGLGVARGYWRRPDATEERFRPDELASRFGSGPGGRLYRTGDLVRITPRATLAYLGRLDFQVKVRGHRIELEEIEAVMDEHPAVERSVVTAHQAGAADKRLVAYVKQRPGRRAEAEELRRHVAGRLPAMMVPAVVVLLEEFPLTPNKKVDRRALPLPRFGEVATGRLAPRNDEEERLAAIWRHVLSVEQVGVTDDFFAIGGNSLLAVFLTAEMNKLGWRLTLGQLLKTPTIAGLAGVVAAQAGQGGQGGQAAAVAQRARRADA